MKQEQALYKKKMLLFDYINYIIMIFLCFIFIYPILMTLGLSFSDAKEMVGKNVFLLPAGFSLTSYKAILSVTTILRH